MMIDFDADQGYNQSAIAEPCPLVKYFWPATILMGFYQGPLSRGPHLIMLGRLNDLIKKEAVGLCFRKHFPTDVVICDWVNTCLTRNTSSN
jgi:hypothetical protein